MENAQMPEIPALRENLAFAYRVYEPAAPDGSWAVLLHGSGTDETALASFAGTTLPRTRLLAVRGRVVQEDSRRWFARITPIDFDQDSIRKEAEEFSEFLAQAGLEFGFHPADAIGLGYSNGANLVSSIMFLHPGLIRRAVLMRAMPVLHAPPPTSLIDVSVLVLSGKRDVTYGPYAASLIRQLRRHGADVEAHTVDAGHEFSGQDSEHIRKWLGGNGVPDRPAA